MTIVEYMTPQAAQQRLPKGARINTSACIWCETKFAARKSGGSAQRFCSKDCRQDFHIACRIWAVQEYEAGRVSLTALRSPPGQRARCIERDSDPKGPLVA